WARTFDSRSTSAYVNVCPSKRSAVASGRLRAESRRRCWRRKAIAGSPSEPEPGRDDVPLDLRGPRVDARGHGVPQVALDLELGGEAVAAVDLDGVEARLHPALAQVELGHGRVEHGVLSGRLQASDLVEQQPGGLHAHLHVHDLVGDRLELADRLVELLA